MVVPAEPAGGHGDDNGYAGSADVNNIDNKLFVTTGSGNFYNQLYAAFKVAVAVHNKNNYKALEINEKNAGW